MTKSLPKFLYKYRGGAFARDLKALEENFIWAASPETLNDPFEVTVVLGKDEFLTIDLLTRSLLELRPESKRTWEPQHKSFLDAVTNFAESVRKWGIFSLAHTPLDELSWAHYANSHQGFCIEYDLERLQEQALRQELVLRVEYQDRPPLIEPALILGTADPNLLQLTTRLVSTKSTRWRHEGEWRVVTGTPGKKAYDYRAATAIYFGYRMTEEEKLAIMARLQGRGISYYQMKLVPSSYELEAVAILDPLHDAPRYLDALAPIEAGVPLTDQYLSSHEGFTELIEKAIEIVRREPYCFKVTFAYVSGSKGTPEDPVFYVTCDGPNGIPKNFWLSKREIEDRFAALKVQSA